MRRLAGVVMTVGVLLMLNGCVAKTTGATNITDVSATLHGTGRCDRGQTCTWYWEYWPANQPRSSSTRTRVWGPVSGSSRDVNLAIAITGLRVATAYHWVLCASPNDGGVYACAGPHGTFGSPTVDPPPDEATLATAPVGTLAERWNGTAWTIQPSADPLGAQGSFLQDVSCPSSTACTAVGHYDSVGTHTLAERWDGRSWTVQPTPDPSGAQSSFLQAVSCASATACTAVGNDTDAAGHEVPLAEAWDGSRWTVQPTPNPSTTSAQLSGVSCTSAAACTAVGVTSNFLATDVTLAERWDGTSWTVQPTPAPNGPPAGLDHVSCTSSTLCIAVGAGLRGDNTYSTLAEVWSGTDWMGQGAANPGDANDRDPLTLTGVSCTSATACTAIGSYTNGAGTEVALLERWDGRAWTIQTAPTAAGALSAVACGSLTACVAVGNNRSPLAWDGTTWTIQATPSPTGALSGVACTSATACTAVGHD